MCLCGATGLEVFVDDEFQGSTAAAAPDYGLGTQRTLGAWDKLSGFETTRKENEHRSSKWKGSLLTCVGMPCKPIMKATPLNASAWILRANFPLWCRV